MSGRMMVAIVVFIVLWVAWCFYAVGTLTPIIELHLAFWHWLIAWILCLVPLIVFAVFVVVQVRRRRRV